MKKIFLKIIVAAVSIILIFSPFLLLIDLNRFLPIVVFIWMLSVSYFLFIKQKR